MATDPRLAIDYSRYRVAEAIAELYAAGESVTAIAGSYLPAASAWTDENAKWVIELIVAAHDRKGRYEPSS